MEMGKKEKPSLFVLSECKYDITYIFTQLKYILCIQPSLSNLPTPNVTEDTLTQHTMSDEVEQYMESKHDAKK